MEQQFIKLSVLFNGTAKENRKHRREVMDEKSLDFNQWIRACEKLGGDEVDRICAEVDEEYKKERLANTCQEVIDEKQKTHSVDNQKDK